MRAAAAYPLRFAPVYKQAIWGGGRIAARYARSGAPAPCAESWEIAAHADGDGVLLNGPWSGATLAALTRAQGRDLLGTAAPEAHRFPLLFKIIDARECLSLQVHPNARAAARGGGEPKNESWYLLDAEPGALLYAGLAAGATPAALAAALAGGAAEELLVRHAATPRQALHIPAGLVHAIGAGCLIYEVQQSSNTTYRLYDWNRVDASGRRRELHLDAGLEAIDWNLPPPSPQLPVALDAAGPNRWSAWPDNPYFRLRHLRLEAEELLRPAGVSFIACFVEGGAVEIATGARAEKLAAGDSCLVPACADACRLRPLRAPATLLVTTLAVPPG